ncbi:hypothetical protein A0J48_013560 [Sphaerospermopsis aphanizomenoides BCCUSP55]|uniref:hypothetical protein n=1 Tax=Sphaerospermopsis aphanizomenoides TaxID=459663 RepID=UPI001906A2DF|nr:hypothetical protein [Sphaerospermopsis aphanizomenoides]MBK1988553.1 hypothetical protein [Sphaerospermopsis aphanizomenoides BCCUSP55]
MSEILNSQPNLNQIIRPIIGETCHQVRFSYGDELRLHFGEMKPYNHPKLKHLRKGSWQLSTRATPWFLMHNNMFLFLPLLPKLTTDHAQVALQCFLENKKLTNFVIDPNNFQLTLSFEDSYELVLEPDLEDDSGLAYWELLMPNEQILIVGPGQFWECKSIHETA